MTGFDQTDGHLQVTRRRLFQLGSAVLVARDLPAIDPGDTGIAPELAEAVAKLQYLTATDRISTVLDKGKAGVADLSPERLRQVGLVPETWSLDVVPDPASNCVVEQPLSRKLGNALDWNGLMKLGERYAVRFMQVCSCTNGPDPFHVSLWEGVPLREVILLARPKENVRRVYYQSYHPEGAAPFQSSLPLGQILESPPGEMPVVLAYKRNGQPVPASHGGPVRMIVPGAYGSKHIKWVQRVVLTNEFKANDSDADLNNDPENALKTRARFVNAPKEAPAGKPFALTGMAQIGISGLKKVQYCVHSQQATWPADDPYLTKAGWKDCSILPPPEDWGGGLPGGRLPATNQTDAATGKPLQWPLRYAIAFWAALVPGLAPGTYELCCRTIDENDLAQPLPRTLPRTGFNAIHRVPLIVI
jgi:hypothetical protein